MNTNDITLAQMRFVCAVAEEGAFRRAAKRCQVSQPTLSVQIQNLERILGVKVFDRESRPVQLTTDGELVVQQAKALLFSVDRFARLSQEASENLEGELRLGVLPTLTPFLVPRFATKFVEKYPRINLVIHELITDSICKEIEQRELDVGIVSGPLGRPQFEERVILTEAYLCYMSSGHPLLEKKTIAKEDLCADDAWLLTDGHCFRDEVLGLCGATREKSLDGKRLWFESGSLSTIKSLVDSGVGYTLLPELTVDQLTTRNERSRIRRFADPEPTRTITMVNGRYFNKRQLLAVLQDEIVASLPGIMAEQPISSRP